MEEKVNQLWHYAYG